MDNHPIPQDVTNFQFRLIGDMTLKQFAYLGIGAVLGWLVFILPIIFLIKFPIAIFVGLCGAFLAFAPIEGRPADTVLMNFIKALFAPNEYVYQQMGGTITPQQTATIDTKTVAPEEKKEAPVVPQTTFFESTQTAQVAAAAPHVTPLPVEEHLLPAAPQAQPVVPEKREAPKTEADVAKQEQTLAMEKQNVAKALQDAKLQEAQTTAGSEAHEKAVQLEQELTDILKQKQDLEMQLVMLKQELAQKKHSESVTPVTAAEPKKQTERVRKIPNTLGKSVGLPIAPDVPNLISGIVKDPRGNVLPNILIEVKDTEDNPVRAFKTNALGQFASATPLLNGEYTISFEDPAGKNKFDLIDITADGNILLPIEVISIDAREELRKELFGQQQT